MIRQDKMKVCDVYRNDFLNITEETPTLDIMNNMESLNSKVDGGIIR